MITLHTPATLATAASEGGEREAQRAPEIGFIGGEPSGSIDWALVRDTSSVGEVDPSASLSSVGNHGQHPAGRGVAGAPVPRLIRVPHELARGLPYKGAREERLSRAVSVTSDANGRGQLLLDRSRSTTRQPFLSLGDLPLDQGVTVSAVHGKGHVFTTSGARGKGVE